MDQTTSVKSLNIALWTYKLNACCSSWYYPDRPYSLYGPQSSAWPSLAWGQGVHVYAEASPCYMYVSLSSSLAGLEAFRHQHHLTMHGGCPGVPEPPPFDVTPEQYEKLLIPHGQSISFLDPSDLACRSHQYIFVFVQATACPVSPVLDVIKANCRTECQSKGLHHSFQCTVRHFSHFKSSFSGVAQAVTGTSPHVRHACDCKSAQGMCSNGCA